MFVDPQMHDLIRGIKHDNKSLKDAISKDPFDIAYKKYIKLELEKLHNQYDTFTNKLLSPNERQKKIENEIDESLDCTELEHNLALAVEIIKIDGLRYLGKEEYQELIDELQALKSKITDINLQPENIADIEIPSILDSCLMAMFKIGISKYREKKYHDSLALFALLSTLAPNDPNYWYRLGLVAQKLQKLDLAIKAYSAAEKLVPDYVGIRIFSVYCHLLLNDRDSAEAQLKEAKSLFTTSNTDDEEWQNHILNIESLLQDTVHGDIRP